MASPAVCLLLVVAAAFAAAAAAEASTAASTSTSTITSTTKGWRDYTPQRAPAASCPQAPSNAALSRLWGCAGEAWDRGGGDGGGSPSPPLLDWSFAGYGAGEAAIPDDAPVSFDVVRDFGAAGDGRADDTAAVLAALAAASASARRAGGGGGSAVVFFPPGTYALSAQVNLTSGVVLRGAGRDASTLLFLKPLSELHGGSNGSGDDAYAQFSPSSASPWTWRGGMISNARGRADFAFPDTERLVLADVAAPAPRGATRLLVSNLRRGAGGSSSSSGEESDVFPVGRWVTVAARENRAADLARALSLNRTAEPPLGAGLGRDFGDGQLVAHASRVVAAGPGWVELERPLPLDLWLEHRPRVMRAANWRVRGVGVEDMTLRFAPPRPPRRSYRHHQERGYNAVELEGAFDSWLRRLRIVNAEAAVRLYCSSFVTVSDVEIGADNGDGAASKDGDGGDDGGALDGHMGVALHWGCRDVLVEGVRLIGGARYAHDFAVAGYSASNVVRNVSGSDLLLDHHAAAPSSNLWSDVDAGAGRRVFAWSGDVAHAPLAGASNVFWNVRAGSGGGGSGAAVAPLPMPRNRPAALQGSAQVAVGTCVDARDPLAQDWWIEERNSCTPGAEVWPHDLWAAQLAARAAARAAAGGQGELVMEPLAALAALVPGVGGGSGNSHGGAGGSGGGDGGDGGTKRQSPWRRVPSQGSAATPVPPPPPPPLVVVQPFRCPISGNTTTTSLARPVQATAPRPTAFRQCPAEGCSSVAGGGGELAELLQLFGSVANAARLSVDVAAGLAALLGGDGGELCGLPPPPPPL